MQVEEVLCSCAMEWTGGGPWSPVKGALACLDTWEGSQWPRSRMYLTRSGQLRSSMRSLFFIFLRPFIKPSQHRGVNRYINTL